MTIDELYRLVQDLANKDQKGFVSPDQFNAFASEAQLEVARKHLARYLGAATTADGGAARTAALPSQLLPLLGRTALTTVLPGQFDLPSGYWQWTALDCTVAGRLVSVPVLDAKSFTARRSSRFIPATSEYPVAMLHGGQILTAPALPAVELSWLRYPARPKWAFTVVGDEPRHLPGLSQNLELPASAHLEIAFMLCQMIGVNISNELLLQFGMSKQQASI